MRRGERPLAVASSTRAARSGLAAVVALCVTACAAHSTSRNAASPDTPASLLARAIDRAGGVRALERARALRWEGEATVHAGDRPVAIRGTWAIEPPDRAVVATYDVTRGPATLRRLIVAGAAGWLEQAGKVTPMPPAMLASERDEFYVYDVIRLVSLRAPHVTLGLGAPDALGQRGLEIRAPARPVVYAYLDAGGRLAHLRLRITDARTGGEAWQDLWLAGII